jgi:hypothetical protein
MRQDDTTNLEPASIDPPAALTIPTIIRTYLIQRFNIAIYLALGTYLLLFAKAELRFAIGDVFSLLVIILFLLSMRLYDDLQNIQFDQSKPARIYTNPVAAKKLYLSFLVCAIAVLCFTVMRGPTKAVALLTFYIVNHGIYVLLVNHAQWRYFLPLLKYPFVVALMSGSLSIGHVSLFFAFLTFDLIDDPAFPMPRWSGIITSLITSGLLLMSGPTGLYVFHGALALVATGLTLLDRRYSGYAVLIVFLIAKLSMLVYEI